MLHPLGRRFTALRRRSLSTRIPNPSQVGGSLWVASLLLGSPVCQVASQSIQFCTYIACSHRVSHLLDISYLFVYLSIPSCSESVPLRCQWLLSVNSGPSSRVRIEAKPRKCQWTVGLFSGNVSSQLRWLAPRMLVVVQEMRIGGPRLASLQDLKARR